LFLLWDTEANNAPKKITLANIVAYLNGALTAQVNLQSSTPGTAQTGHINISGTAISGKVKTQETYYTSVINNGDSGVAKTIDWTAGDMQTITTTGSCTLTFIAPTGPAPGPPGPRA
jgi:hypothetical protein